MPSTLAQVLDDPDFYKLPAQDRASIISGFPEGDRANILRPDAMPQLPGPKVPVEEISSGVHPLAGYSPAMEAAQPFYGAAKGGASTAGGLIELLTKVPGLRNVIPQSELDAIERGKANTEAVGTAQTIGKVSEQVGEFALPGAGATKLERAAKFSELAPSRLSKLGKLLLRPTAEAAGSELVNEAQGGTPGAGAAASVGGTLIGAGGRGLATKVYPKAKELAANPLLKLMGYGGGIYALTHEGGYGGGEYSGADSSRFIPAAIGAATVAGLANRSTRGSIVGSFLQLFDRQEPGTKTSGRGARIGTAR